MAFFLISTSLVWSSDRLPLTQQNKIKQVIKAEARKAMLAFQAGNHEVLLSYTHPRVIDLSGGREKLLKELEKAHLADKKDNFKLLNSRFYAKKPIVVVGTQWHCLIERHSFWQTSESKKSWLRSHLLAVSVNKGKSWYFVEVNSLSDELLNKLFSSFDIQVKKNFYYFGPGFQGQPIEEIFAP